MYEVKNFSDWELFIEPVGGANEKDWYVKDGERGLFKFAKGGGSDFICGEWWSEKMASDIFKACQLKAMEVDMGIIDGRLGSMCHDFTKQYGSFIEYSTSLVNDNGCYSLESAGEFLSSNGYQDFVTMLLVDIVIGNSDRHSGNFGRLADGHELAPIYDSGSSLCCRVDPKEAPLFLSDKMRMNRFTSKELKTFVEYNNIRMKRTDLLELLKEGSRRQLAWGQLRLDILDEPRMDNILHNFSSTVDSNLLQIIKQSILYRREVILNFK